MHDDRGFGPTGVMLASLHGMQHLETKYMVDVLRVVACKFHMGKASVA